MERMDAQAAMMDLIRELRADPERYRRLKEQIAASKTDEERVKVLTDFSIAADRLKQVLPDDGGKTARGTTVTVTTVIIIAPSAY